MLSARRSPGNGRGQRGHLLPVHPQLRREACDQAVRRGHPRQSAWPVRGSEGRCRPEVRPPVLESRGSVGDEEMRAVRAAGFGDREIVELVAHVALNVLTNYFNKVAQVDVEFPSVEPLAAAA